MDYLDRLYDQYKEFFDGLDRQMIQEFDEHWEDYLTEPSQDELAEMDRYAELLLMDILGDENE